MNAESVKVLIENEQWKTREWESQRAKLEKRIAELEADIAWREAVDDANLRGRAAYLDRLPESACPHTGEPLRDVWLSAYAMEKKDAELRAELATTNELLAERNRVLDALECEICTRPATTTSGEYAVCEAHATEATK